MQEHARAEAEAQEFATREYIHNVAGTGRSAADEIELLADMKAKGVITEAEFQAAKAQALG